MVHSIFALVSGDRIRELVVGEYFVCDQIAKEKYGAEAYAAEATQYAVEEGDVCSGGVFRKLIDGELVEVPRTPTENERIEILSSKIAGLENEMTVTGAALTEFYEEYLGGE